MYFDWSGLFLLVPMKWVIASSTKVGLILNTMDHRPWLAKMMYYIFLYMKCVVFLFRDIVLASHIKPLQKGDTLENMTFDVKWNSHADKNKTNSTPSSDTSAIKKVRLQLHVLLLNYFISEWLSGLLHILYCIQCRSIPLSKDLYLFQKIIWVLILLKKYVITTKFYPTHYSLM
jgi:hypothetical protein